MNGMSKELAAQALTACEQMEAALADGDELTIGHLREELVKYFRYSDRDALKVALECVRARAEQVLSEETE